MTRLERVARAMCVADRGNPDAEDGNPPLSQLGAVIAAEREGRVLNPQWKAYTDRAKAYLAIFDAAAAPDD